MNEEQNTSNDDEVIKVSKMSNKYHMCSLKVTISKVFPGRNRNFARSQQH